MAKKYEGVNAYKLEYLPERYRDLYEAGLLSDVQVDSMLSQVKDATSSPSADSITAGPMTPEEQARAEGFVGAGGSQAGTGRAAAANLRTEIGRQGQGIGEILAEGAVADLGLSLVDKLTPLPVRALVGEENTQSLRDFFSAGVSRVLPDSVTTKEGKDLAAQELQGREAAVSMARDRTGLAGNLAIDAPAAASQAATSLAALLATRSPQLAMAVGGAGLLDIATKVMSNTYLEGKAGGQDMSAIADRTLEKLSIEGGTELLGLGGDTVSAAKAIAKVVGVGAAQEGAAEIGNIVLDKAKYEQFAPETLEDAAKQVGYSTLLGGLTGGVIAGPAAFGSARATETGRINEALNQFKDPATNQGFKDGEKIFEAIKAGKPSGDLFADKPEFAPQEGPAAPGTGYQIGEDGIGFDPTKPAAEPTAMDPGKSLFTQKQLKQPAQPKTALEETKKRVAKEAAAKEKAEQVAAAKKIADQKKKLEALRPGIQADVLAKNPNLQPREFDAIVQIRMRKAKMEMEAAAAAEEANPTKKGKKGAAPLVSKTAPAPIPAKPVPAPATPATSAVIDQIEKEQVFSLPKKAELKGKRGLSREQLVNKFVYDESADGYRFREALRSGKVKVVRNLGEIKEMKDPKTGEAHPITKRAKGVHITKTGDVYLAADNLNDDDLMGTMLHEVTHHMIRKHKDGKAPGGLSALLGQKGVETSIGKIQNLAKGGNKLAKQAMNRYESALAANPNGTQREEILTYFIEEGRIARQNKGVLGSAGVVLSDLVRGAKVGVKNATGLGANIDVNDLQVYANKMVSDLGKAKKAAKFADPNYQLPEDTKEQFSFVGDRSGLMDDDRLVTAFVGADGKRRREIDTSGFKVNPGPMSKLFSDGKSTVGSLLGDADILTKEAYNGTIGKISVRYDKKAESGYWDPVAKEIVLGPHYFSPEAMKSVVLHEVQHAIQQQEGFAKGTNVRAKMAAFEASKLDRDGAKAKALTEELTASKDSLASTLQALAAAVDKLPSAPRGFSTLKNMASLPDGNSFDSKLAYDSLANVVGGILKQRKAGTAKEDALNALASNPKLKKLMWLAEDISTVSDRAYEDYMNEAGEVESRAVEQRKFMSKAEREQQPDPLQTIEENEGRDRKKFTINTGRPTDPGAFQLSIDPDVTYPRGRSFGTGRGVAPVVIPGTKGKVAITRESALGRGHAALNALFKNKIPRAVEEMRARETGEVNGYALDALNNLNLVNEAINSYHNPQEAVDALKDYENSASRSERLAKAEVLKDTMPSVFSAYNGARRNIFRMSQEIIYLMESRGYRATEKEKAVINGIRNNLGNYLTTTYKALGPSKVRAAHIRYLYSTKEGLSKREAAKQWARDNIFTFNELEDRSESWLRAAYEAIVPLEYQSQERSADALDRKELIERLAAVEKVVPDSVLDKVSAQFVEDLLRVGRASSSIGRAAKMFRGSGQDMTIITPKTQVPEVIRDLWGEQDNPVMNVFATMVKQGEFIAKAKSQYRMLDEMRGTYIFDNWGEMPEGAQSVQIKSDGMGPLAGKWTTPELKDFLEAKADADQSVAELINMSRYAKDHVGAFVGAGKLATQGLGKLGSTFKWMSVVWKPINWVYNYGGSYAQMLMNGNYGKYAAKGHKIAFKEAPNSPFKKYSSDELQELIRNGVLDSSLAGEIQERERQSIVQGVLEQGKNPTIQHSKLEKFTTGVTDLYAGADIWAKVANYFSEKDHVAAYHKAMGHEVTTEQLERETAERIRQTNFSYDQAWAPAKFFEKNGITNFLTYNMEVFRTAIGNLRYGMQDIAMGRQLAATNPEAAKIKMRHGTARLAGVTAAIGLHSVIFTAMGEMLASLIEAPEEDEKERTIMKGVADMFSGGLLKLVGIQGDKREYFDAGRLDPYGPMNEIARAIASGDMTKMKESVTGLWIMNEVLAEAASAATAAVKDGEQKARPPRFKGTAPDVYEIAKDKGVSMGLSPSVTDRALRAVESMTPSVLTTIVTQAFSEENQDPVRRLFTAAGGRLITYDPKEDLRSHASYEYSTPLNSIRNSWSTWSKAVINPSPEAIKEKYEQAANEEFDLWSKALPKIEAARAAGLPLRLIQAELKAGNLGQEQINSLTRGKFYPSVISPAKLKGDEDFEIKAAGDDKAKINRIRQKYKTLRSVVSSLSRNYVAYEE